MAEYQTITYDVDDAVIATLMFNRPEQRNAATPTLIGEVRAALGRVHTDPDVRVLVLTGAGKTFCPGTGPDWDASSAPELESPIRVDASTPKLLYEAPVPTIAAVNGACAGVGLALACACDLRVAASSAVFRSAFLSVGLAGDMGLPWLLSRIVGPSVARQISFLDAKIGAEEAVHIGLAGCAVPDDEFPAQVRALAGKLAASAPLAARVLKAGYLAAERLSFSDFVDLEFQRHFHLLATADAEEGLAALGDRRTPRFTGR